MKLYFKQRFFSWFDSYDIYDEAGNTVFTVEGQLAWAKTLHISDKNGTHIATLKREIFTFLPEFCIYKGDTLAGRISKELSLFSPKYNIDFNGWHIDGDFFEWDYTIMGSNGEQIAVVSKELLNFTDTYVINTVHDADALDALMFTLAIDAEKASRR